MRTLISAFAAALLLAGCSSMGIDPSSPSGRTVDPLRDDIASLLIAFDLPRGLGPAKGSLFTFDVANGGASEHLRLPIVEADAESIEGRLPAPAPGRAYYVFAFSEADRVAIRSAQATALARGVTGNNVTVGVVPHLCTTPGLDPNMATVSVLASLPGQRQPLAFLNQQSLAVLLTQPGSTQMPFCNS